MRICVVRHGETAWNHQRRYQGQLDIDLNARGEAQAVALRPVIAAAGFSAIYASDLKRAWRTAELACAPRAVLPAPSFRERHYGVFQGLTVDEARDVHPRAHAHYHARSPEYNFESGESLIDFADRVVSALDELTTSHAGQCIALFTHGGVLDILYRHVTRRGLAGPRDFAIPNAAVNWLDCADGVWRIECWADTAHLTTSAVLDEVAR